MLSSGAYGLVVSGGPLNGATLSGGVLEFQSGGTAGSSTITLARGTLRIDNAQAFGSATRIAGLATAAPQIDLVDINIGAATLGYVNSGLIGTLTVGDGVHVAPLNLIGSYALGSFKITNDGGGRTLANFERRRDRIAALTPREKCPRPPIFCYRPHGRTPTTRRATSMTAFLKTTLVGGVLFLLPLAIVLMILAYALRLASTVAQPISDGLDLQRWGGVAGVGAVTLLSGLVLLVLAFAAGLAARTWMGERVTRWFEGSLLGRLPQYQMLKSMAEGLAQLESAKGIKPALISIEGGWQIGYLLEPLQNGWSSVFLPQAPTPMSGNIMYFPADRVRPLEITMVDAMAIIKRIGVGSGAALRGADLKLPAGQ